MMFPHGVTVTVRRPSGEDRYGQPLPGTEHTIRGCGLAPGSSTESHAGGDRVTSDVTLYADAGVDIEATDTVVIPGGEHFEVEGVPQRWSNPYTGWQAGTVVHLRRITG